MAKQAEDPGIGAFSKDKAQRFINPSGNFNVKHLNKKNSINEAYIYLLKIDWFRFFFYLSCIFLFINVVFAITYVLLGVENIGIKPTTFFSDFIYAVFFSVQTLSTLGYGHYSPTDISTGVVSSIEAIIGVISFAFITGLMYGRFSKPHSNIRFSKELLLCNQKGVDALMFRVMNRRNGMALLPKVRVSLSMAKANENGEIKNQFYTLRMERNAITYLPTTWTLVHLIDEKSPLYGYERSQISALQGEFLILFSYQDEYFNEELHQAYSYMLRDIKIGYTFKKAFYYDQEGQAVIDHDEFDAVTIET